MVMDRMNNGRLGGQSTTAGVNMRSKRIQAGLSTQIVIQVESDTEPGKFYNIGAIQSLAYNQNRPTQAMQEIGTDGILQIVPNGATTHSLTINRMIFDFQRLPQALQREYRHIHAQRRPFNIVVKDYNPYVGGDVSTSDADGNNPAGGGGTQNIQVGGVGQGQTATSAASVTNNASLIETVFQNCWFTTLNMSYNANSYTIAEDATLQVEHVFDRQTVATLQGPTDSLERNTNVSQNASVMSAFDATRQS